MWVARLVGACDQDHAGVMLTPLSGSCYGDGVGHDVGVVQLTSVGPASTSAESRALVTTLALTLFSMALPLLVLLAFTWLINALFDERSLISRGFSRLEEASIVRRSLAA